MGVVVIIQLSYPSKQALPFARLNGENVGMKSASDIRQKVTSEYVTVPLAFEIDQKVSHGTTAQAGLLADDTEIAETMTGYSWWQRLIPFSLPVLSALKNQPIVTKIDEARFADYAAARAQECVVVPQNAGVIVQKEIVQLDPAKDGRACPKSNIRAALLGMPLQKEGITVRVKTEKVKPDRSDKDVSSELNQAQTVIDRKLTVELKDKKLSVGKSTIASWLIFPQDSKTKQLSVSVDNNKIKEYLESIQNNIYVEPGTTEVYTLDGAQTGSTKGSTGLGIDKTATATDLHSQVLKDDGTVKATLQTLQPNIDYKRSYTATQTGLQALLYDIVRDKGDYAIAVQTINGGIVATANSSKHYHPASTYKIFIGWAIIQRIAAGQMSWTDSATSGKNVSQCFDAMIISSDNACGEWLGQQIGWTNLNNMLKSIGLSCTNLSTAWYSCAGDETLFLYKLQTGQLLPSDQADRLLSVMKQQTYRSGIPAGVGVTVADKVGFLDGLLHDSAIVYAEHGTYVLTIMTNGSSWSQIADAAKQINAQLNRM